MLIASIIHAFKFTANGLRGLVENVVTLRRNRAALMQLDLLDDHLLEDIGLTRYDLQRAHALAPYKNPYMVSPFASHDTLIESARVNAQRATAPTATPNFAAQSPCCPPVSGVSV